MSRRIEILAPAGSRESMVAAIGAGADAVYMGGSRFGARAYADNLDTEAMLAAIDYVHLRDRQLYLTVNTLLKEEEVDDLYHYLKPFYEEGLDAVIVQDVGVMEFIHREFPHLPIHASTQMTLTMAEGAECFSDYGVTRLVNARELSLKELARIRQSTTLEIESFVHGALCYCYSGQCLMSSMIGGRSGNRGRCAQPCRMEYRTAGQREKKYLLSPKDMCTLDMIPELIAAGIDSFKIEGRMKRYEYAAGVAGAYRREVDRFFELGDKGYRQFHEKHPEVLRDTVRDLKDLYNRGDFTKGYYLAHNGKAMMSMARPNHSGVEVAKVVQVKKNAALLQVKEDLNAQDVLEIRMQNGEAYEYTLKEACRPGTPLWSNFMPGSPVKPGDLVFRTKNNALLERISKTCYETEKKQEIYGRLTATVGEPLCLELWRGEVRIRQLGDVVEAAQKQPMTEEKLRTSLMKTGETMFCFAALEIQCFGEIFVPVSKLNELRRTALERLEEALLAKWRRESLPERSSQAKQNQEKEAVASLRQEEPAVVRTDEIPVSASVMTMEQWEAVLAEPSVRRIYYDISLLSVERIPELAGRAQECGKAFFVRLPQICRAETYDWLKQQEAALLAPQVDGYLLRNYEELQLFGTEWKEKTAHRQMITDAMLYVMNREAKEFYRKKGIVQFTAPYEQNLEELTSLGLQDMEVTVYGRLPLMTSAQCVLKNTTGCLEEGGRAEPMPTLTDRKHKEMPVRTFCRFCYNTIYNAECLSLFEELERLNVLHPAGLRFDFTFETAGEV
ncbi:MAG: U32 family peptidase, partial [Lachnospiraceae bacterium]|nr:U32 family peptidase [Lachnospiraceae bacterium]